MTGGLRRLHGTAGGGHQGQDRRAGRWQRPGLQTAAARPGRTEQ